MPYTRHTYYSDMVDQPTRVYRFYDARGRLLYVGLSMNFGLRLVKHRQRSWWPLVKVIRFEFYEGREAAKAAEWAAIANENPIYNVTRPAVS